MKIPRNLHAPAMRLLTVILTILAVFCTKESLGFLGYTHLENDIYSQATKAKSHLEIYKLLNDIESRKNNDPLGIDAQISIQERDEFINKLIKKSGSIHLTKTDDIFFECIKQDNFKKWPNISQSFWSCSKQYNYLIETDLSLMIESIEAQKNNKEREFWLAILYTSITALTVTHLLDFFRLDIFKKKSKTNRLEVINPKDFKDLISSDELEYLRSSLADVFSDLSGSPKFEINEKTKMYQPSYAERYFDYIDVPPSNILYKMPSKDLVLD